MTDNLHRHSAQYSSFTCSTLTLVQADKLFIRHPTVDFFNLLNWIYFFIALNCTYDNNNLKSLVWDKKEKRCWKIRVQIHSFLETLVNTLKVMIILKTEMRLYWLGSWWHFACMA